MIKGIKISGNTADKKIDVIAKICFGQLPSTELRLLRVIIDYATNNSITITPELSKQILVAANLTQSSFGTALHRLEKKRVLNSMGKTKLLHPVFKDILTWEKILINFEEIKKEA